MANKPGIAIYIKAFVPVPKDIDGQVETLTAIKEAKTSGKFDAVLAKAIDIEVKTESKTRRIEEQPPVNNEHVADGAQKFTEDEIKANADDGAGKIAGKIGGPAGKAA